MSEYYMDVYPYEAPEPEPNELTDEDIIARLTDELDAALTRIAELESQVAAVKASNDGLSSAYDKLNTDFWALDAEYKALENKGWQ